jgi:mxaD protein
MDRRHQLEEGGMRKLVAALFGWLALNYAAGAMADAQEQTVMHGIAIAAPPDAVWAVAGDFVGLPKWYPPIESSRLVLGRNNEVNCIRELTRRNGTKVTERLLDYDQLRRRLEYTYVDGMVMSSDYFAVLEVKDAGDGTSLVEWKARFKRLAYWTDNPPPGQDDETVLKALNAGYKLGLENLKKMIEARDR